MKIARKSWPKNHQIEPRNYKKIYEDLQAIFQVASDRCFTCVHALHEKDNRVYCLDKCKQFARYEHSVYSKAESVWICHDEKHKYFHGQVCHDLVHSRYIIYRCPFLYRLEQQFSFKSVWFWVKIDAENNQFFFLL